MARQCYLLTAVELAAMLAAGYTQISGPHDSEIECNANCAEPDPYSDPYDPYSDINGSVIAEYGSSDVNGFTFPVSVSEGDLLLINIYYFHGSAASISGVTVGGAAATIDPGDPVTQSNRGLVTYYYDVPADDLTASVVVTMSTTVAGLIVNVVRVTGLVNNAPSQGSGAEGTSTNPDSGASGNTVGPEWANATVAIFAPEVIGDELGDWQHGYTGLTGLFVDGVIAGLVAGRVHVGLETAQSEIDSYTPARNWFANVNTWS